MRSNTHVGGLVFSEDEIIIFPQNMSSPSRAAITVPRHQHSITSHMSPSDTLFIVFKRLASRLSIFISRLHLRAKPTENIILVLWRKLWTKLNTIMMTQSDWLIKWRMTLQQHKISRYSLNLSLKLLGLRLQHHFFFIDSKNAQKLKLKNMHRDFYNSVAGRH